MSRIIGFDPIFHEQDTILILGSMPSVESLRQAFYYANKTNRFWPMLAKLYEMPVETIEHKLLILENAKIALWDVCHSCLRKGSADASIKEVQANPIDTLLKKHETIKKVICNGKTSYALLRKYFPDIEAICCPSTSAANARFRLDDLVKIYGEELKNYG